VPAFAGELRASPEKWQEIISAIREGRFFEYVAQIEGLRDIDGRGLGVKAADKDTEHAGGGARRHNKKEMKMNEATKMSFGGLVDEPAQQTGVGTATFRKLENEKYGLVCWDQRLGQWEDVEHTGGMTLAAAEELAAALKKSVGGWYKMEAESEKGIGDTGAPVYESCAVCGDGLLTTIDSGGGYRCDNEDCTETWPK